MNVYAKLNEARKQLAATEMKKSGKNKFAGYTYFELGDFLNPITSIFNDIGLCAVVSFDELLATMTITNIDMPQEQIVFTSPMSNAKLKGCHDIQNLGACETYNRRYLYMTALEIVEHDALDSSKPLQAELTPQQQAKVDKLKKDGDSEEAEAERVVAMFDEIFNLKTKKNLDDWKKKNWPEIQKMKESSINEIKQCCSDRFK